jgi:ankyrin repeat protein
MIRLLLGQQRFSGVRCPSIFPLLEQCDVRTLETFLQQFPKKANALGNYGLTPLQHLAGGRRLSVTQEPPLEFALLLLKHGADVNAQGALKQTPLEIAARSGYGGIAQELIRARATLTPQLLDDALLRSVNFDPYFRLERSLLNTGKMGLEKRGPELLATLIDAYKLHHCEEHITTEFLRHLNAKIQFLLDEGVDPDLPFEGKTALQRCLMHLDSSAHSPRLRDTLLRKAALTLVQRTGNLGWVDERGWSYLHHAIRADHVDLVKELVAQGLNIDPPGDLLLLHPTSALIAALGFSPGTFPELFYSKVHILTTMLHQLPQEYQPIQDYWSPRWPIGKFSSLTTGATGIASLDPNLDTLPLAQAAYETYCGNTSPMVQAMETGDLARVRDLLKRGWNVHIENECSLFLNRPPFYQTFSKEFLRELILAPHSGITLVSEFEAAMALGDTAKLNMLIEWGLTQEQVQTDLVHKWYNQHWDYDEKGLLITFPHYSAVHRMMRQLQQMGWITIDPSWEGRLQRLGERFNPPLE